MPQSLKLRTDEGNEVRITLENWGSGLDGAKRRWTLEDAETGRWVCRESGESAQKASTLALWSFR